MTDRPSEASTGSGDDDEPPFNVDRFYHHPAHHLVGLLTEKSEVAAICRELDAAGVDIAAVEILCGERGEAILDEYGRYHGLRGRIVRTVQRMGYDAQTMDIYDEALRQGELLLRVPAPPNQRDRIAALLQLRQVHQMGYFGRGSFEQIPIVADPG